MDANKSGDVDFEEFSKWWHRTYGIPGQDPLRQTQSNEHNLSDTGSPQVWRGASARGVSLRTSSVAVGPGKAGDAGDARAGEEAEPFVDTYAIRKVRPARPPSSPIVDV